MKKILSLLLVAAMILSLGSISAMAAEASVSVETPVAMTLVSSTDDSYRYNVSVNATVTSGGSALADKEVSILLFGNKDNTAFVSGDNVLNLTAEEIAADYYIYYVNQDATDSVGKVSFTFPVDLPTPAKTDAYYVWVGAETSSAPEKLGLEDMAVSSQVVAVTLTASTESATVGENVTLTPDALNVFGNSVTIAPEYTYSVTQDGNSVEAAIADNLLSTYSLKGIYTVTVSAKAADGSTVTSNGITLSVEDAILLGDPDFNNRINVFDAVIILKHVADIAPIEGDALTAADIDKNAVIDIQDACQVLRYIARIINQL